MVAHFQPDFQHKNFSEVGSGTFQIDTNPRMCYAGSDMKILNFFLAILSCTAVCTAQEPVIAQPATVATPMAQAIEKVTFLTDQKPSTEAKYYMYLASASWCGPCRRVMPKIVAEYPNMMANKDVEIILLSFDQTPEEAVNYLRNYRAPFAAVMYKSEAAELLPGYPKDLLGIPHIVVVDATGKMLYRGHAIHYAAWKTQIEQANNTRQ